MYAVGGAGEYAYPGGQWQQNSLATQSNGLATASMVLGILGVTLIPIVCSLLAVIFGHIASKAAHEGRATNGGQAVAGLVLGYIGLAVLLPLILIFGAALFAGIVSSV
jgi:hypothetical protein